MDTHTPDPDLVRSLFWGIFKLQFIRRNLAALDELLKTL
jgi:hypothetical protein